jgi:Zn-dependent peptidase ImmA (M78 family)
MATFEQRKQAAIHFKREIERQMHETLQGFSSWLGAQGKKLDFPLDIDRFIEFYLGLIPNICCIKEEFPDDEGDALRDTWGALCYRPELGGWAIYIDEYLEEEVRKAPRAFTLAHEGVHYIRHVPQCDKEPRYQQSLFKGADFKKPYTRIFCRKGEENTWREREADYGAACLLAPSDEVLKRIEVWMDGNGHPREKRLEPGSISHRNSVGSLMEQFGLSRAAMEIRLDELGLVESEHQGSLLT